MQLGVLSAAHDVGRDFWLDGTGLARIEVEIGPGSCGYLTAAARRHRDTLFVGIEIQRGALKPVIGLRPAPPNLRLLNADGSWVVRHLLAPASIDAFHVYFPDPWWKKRHYKRRLFQQPFCEALAMTLAPCGAVHVVTDVAPLMGEIRHQMLGAGFVAETWERTGSDLECSSYERKYRAQNRHFEQWIFRPAGADADRERMS
ncbi:MAG TPA: hypothetical protein VGK20_14875 [Candidatus Binatia bacterium]|jgi:tRNA (guanine-N7-)-methyltransferase